MDTLGNIIKTMATQRTAVFRGTLTPDEINKTLFGTGDTAVVCGIPYDTENDRPGVATIGGNLLKVRNGDIIINTGADFFAIHSHVDILQPSKTLKKEDPMGQKRYDEQLRNAGIATRVKNRLRDAHIPYEKINDSFAVAPEHFAILQRITDEVMQEMMQERVQPVCTSADAIRQRIQRKRELAEKCARYYPVMQRCEGFSQQVAAAETISGATHIRGMMSRRNPSEGYFIGPKTIIFSDALAKLEFEPTPLELAEMEAATRHREASLRHARETSLEEIRSLIGQIGQVGEKETGGQIMLCDELKNYERLAMSCDIGMLVIPKEKVDEAIAELKDENDEIQKQTDIAWGKVNAMYDEITELKARISELEKKNAQLQESRQAWIARAGVAEENIAKLESRDGK